MPDRKSIDEIVEKFYDFCDEYNNYKDDNNSKIEEFIEGNRSKLKLLNSVKIEKKDSFRVYRFNGITGDSLGEGFRNKNNGKDGPIRNYKNPKKLKKNNQ